MFLQTALQESLLKGFGKESSQAGTGKATPSQETTQSLMPRRVNFVSRHVLRQDTMEAAILFRNLPGEFEVVACVSGVLKEGWESSTGVMRITTFWLAGYQTWK
jgi:hypothetical protein